MNKRTVRQATIIEPLSNFRERERERKTDRQKQRKSDKKSERAMQQG